MMIRTTLLGGTAVVVLGFLGTDLAGQAPAGQAGPAPGETLSESYRGSQSKNVEYQKIPPFKVFDNLYYVGPGTVAVWLIPTTQGIILIDTAQEPYVDHVLDSIKKVGFDPKDIKYILVSHGHLDHYGGAVRIQQASGARVGMGEGDWRFVEQANARGPVPKRDLVLKAGEKLTLGDTTLTLYETPGHTPGVLSMEFTVFDNGRPHKAFLHGGSGPRGGVDAAKESIASNNRVAQLQGIEVAVTTHSWLNGVPYPNGGILERAQKLAQRKPGEPHPFVDPASFREWVKRVQANSEENLKKTSAAAAAAGRQ